MIYLPTNWQTERLSVHDGTLAEVAERREVFNSCHHVEKWDPTFILVPLDEMTELVAKSVAAPTDGEMQFRSLRFWMNQGSTTIIDYDGDKTHSETTHADIVLEKAL